MKDAKNFGKLFVNSIVVKKRRINVFNVLGLTFTHLYTIVVFTILPHLVTVAFAYTDCTFLVLKFAYTITLLILSSCESVLRGQNGPDNVENGSQ